ncbi:hypothetical protein [Sphingomonas sp.]|uniref:phage head spike fiber domain-containing protein n=1 Tax=Sphingomonas sp. TaxID=28214 RepID=UPI001DB4017A|nr:hypothetical protein [Sphingomonas sp.]MBX9796005.1 hypothetical protein [Sphingomonas sp.]
MGALGLGLGLDRVRRPRAGYDFTGDALPAGVALTRATPGWATGADGRLVLAGVDAARIEHQGGARRGLLVEPAADNLVTLSTGFDAPQWSADAAWGGSVPVVTPAAAPGPDGASPAARLDFVRGDGFSRLFAAVAVSVPGPHCFSVWLRAVVPGPAIALRLDGVAGPTLVLDAVWRRFSVSASTGAAAACQLILWNAIDGAPATASVFAWGMQLERGTAPSSPVVTNGAPATRAADRLTLDAAPLGLGENGSARLRYRFDDGASALRVAAISQGRITVPDDLPGTVLAAVEPA